MLVLLRDLESFIDLVLFTQLVLLTGKVSLTLVLSTGLVLFIDCVFSKGSVSELSRDLVTFAPSRSLVVSAGEGLSIALRSMGEMAAPPPLGSRLESAALPSAGARGRAKVRSCWPTTARGRGGSFGLVPVTLAGTAAAARAMLGACTSVSARLTAAHTASRLGPRAVRGVEWQGGGRAPGAGGVGRAASAGPCGQETSRIKTNLHTCTAVVVVVSEPPSAFWQEKVAKVSPKAEGAAKVSFISAKPPGAKNTPLPSSAPGQWRQIGFMTRNSRIMAYFRGL